MRFDVNTKGKPVLRGVTEQELAYIKSSPARACFSDAINGTVYITAPYAESKAELLETLFALFFHFDMLTSPAAASVRACWQESDDLARKVVQKNKNLQDNEDFLRGQIKQLEKKAKLADTYKRLLDKGCKGCEHFRMEQFGDDCNGYCTAGERARRLHESSLSFEYGEVRDGIRYMGTKYYPHGECQFLKEIRI